MSVFVQSPASQTISHSIFFKHISSSIFCIFNTLPEDLQSLLEYLPFQQVKMCLFSTPKKHRRSHYVEEVVVAPRPVSRHSHHGGHHGRSSYTSVTRTTRPTSREYYTSAPRASQSSYRRSGPVVVEQRRSSRSYR